MGGYSFIDYGNIFQGNGGRWGSKTLKYLMSSSLNQAFASEFCVGNNCQLQCKISEQDVNDCNGGMNAVNNFCNKQGNDYICNVNCNLATQTCQGLENCCRISIGHCYYNPNKCENDVGMFACPPLNTVLGC